MMDWLVRWQDNRIGWHAESVNKELIEYLNLLKLKVRDKVFVPLCGKSIDMLYLLDQGYSVVGVEISEIGIRQFFDDNGLDYRVSTVDNFLLYQTQNIEIYCGDFFCPISKAFNRGYGRF